MVFLIQFGINLHKSVFRESLINNIHEKITI